jgi:hypothetical protein
MPTGKNWLYFIYVNLGFALYIIVTYYLTSVENIKANWPLYRCNPMYMPLSDNIENDFTYCIQNMQMNFMGYLLQPLTYITNSLANLGGSFMTEINFVREMFNKIRNLFSFIIQSVFGVFLNLIIEFQKIIIGIKDLVGKTIGTLVTMMYMLDGSIKTMQSAWNGPSGQMVRALGKCFHPETNIKLKNGDVIQIKDINLGDILEDGSIVEAIMKIDNKRNPEKLYCIKNQGINNADIYVTGSHLVYDNSHNDFIPVKNYGCASEVNNNIEWFSCLITNTHKIKIGNEIFWDWEDHYKKWESKTKLKII